MILAHLSGYRDQKPDTRAKSCGNSRILSRLSGWGWYGLATDGRHGAIWLEEAFIVDAMAGFLLPHGACPQLRELIVGGAVAKRVT